MSTELSQSELDNYRGNQSPLNAGAFERYYCPIHGGDNQRSLVVRKETGGFFCHNCKASGYLLEHKKKWLEEKRRERDTGSSLWRSSRATMRLPPVSQKPSQSLCDRSDLMAMLEKNLTESCIGAKYLHKRGISFSLARRLKAGYLPYGEAFGKLKARTKWGSLAFPHHRNGKIINIYLRHIGGAKPAKHYHLQGLKGVFNEAAMNKDGVHVCEGVFDALSLVKRGLHAAAVFGTTLDWSLVGAKKIVLAFDLDAAGRKASFERSCEGLAYGKEVSILPLSFYSGKDLNI